MIRSICILLCALLLTAFGSSGFAQSLHEQPLVVGWYQNPPFMEFADHLEGDVEGAEIRFARALMNDLGRPVIFRFVSERQIHQALAVGTIDVVLNVKNTAEMRQMAHLSSPYRIESDLAVFTVTGVSVAFAYKAYPLWIWAPLLAVLTSSAGGILRDTIRSYKRIPALTTSVYPEISALCGLGMALALLDSSSVTGIGPDSIIVGTIITAFVLRMLVVVLGIRPLRL